jgi:penicillin-binding protein 1C
MAMLYPRINHAEIFIPRDLDGKTTEAVFEAAHRSNQAHIFWHLNDSYVGQTQSFHKLALAPVRGDHTLTLVDDQGNILETSFRVVSD